MRSQGFSLRNRKNRFATYEEEEDGGSGGEMRIMEKND